MGTLPNAGTISVAHGIPVTANTVFTYIGGTATNPGNSSVPLPFVDTGGAHVEITVDATNVTAVTTVDWTAYTIAYVVLEWIESV